MAAALLIASLASASLPWGQVTVASVKIETKPMADVARLSEVFGVKTGDKLSRWELRAGVQALIATGRVDDVVVAVELGDEGASVDLRVDMAFRVSDVDVSGLPRSLRKRVAAMLELAPGQALRMPAFEASVVRATQLLRDEGYPEARLDSNLQFDREKASVRVRVAGDLGKATVVTGLAAEGVALREQELWDICGLDVGDRLTTAKIEQARRRLERQLERRGYWEAEVDRPTVSQQVTGAQVNMKVRPGPRYELKLVGIKRNKALEQEALPFLRGDERFNPALTEMVTTRLQQFLQRQGYLLARASVEVRQDGDQSVLDIRVTPGPKLKVIAVRFPGLASVPVKTIKERIGVHPGGESLLGGEPVDDESLAADQASILGTLRENGLADARVDPPRIVREGEAAAVEFPIVEGQRRVVGKIAIAGVPPDIKVPTLPIRSGGPWSATAEEQARDLVTAAMQDAGYPDATVMSEHECQAGSCDIALTATAGEKAVVGRVVVAGLSKTRPGVVAKVARLRTGQVAGPDAQLAAQHRLLGLGLFSRVSVHPIPGQEAGAERGVVIDLAEAPTRALSFGIGYDTVALASASVTWSELSLFGTGRGLTLELRGSNVLRHVQLAFREPAALAWLGTPLWAAVYHTDQTYPDYSVIRKGSWVEIGDRKRKPLRFLLRYDYKIVRPFAPPEMLSQLERSDSAVAMSGITPIIEWDTRDDVFTPRHGAFISAQLTSTFHFLSADALFDQLNLSFAGFRKLGSGVVAASLRFGAIHPRNPCDGTCPTDNLRVPIDTRFYAGGPVTNRAFRTDKLGAEGTLDYGPDGNYDEANRTALGGAGQLIGNLEWRFHVYSVVNGTVFVDAGNVWASWRDIRPAGMRWGAGLGLRVDTPVGPLRVEYGWKLDRRPGDTPGELYVSFGNAF